MPAGAIDCGGDYLSPGMVELHTDNLERHIQPRPRVDWPHGAAIIAHDAELASVGITTVFDALRVGSIRSDNPAYAPYALPLANEINALSRAGATRISHVLHLRVEICSETLIAEMEAFGPDHGVRLVSLTTVAEQAPDGRLEDGDDLGLAAKAETVAQRIYGAERLEIPSAVAKQIAQVGPVAGAGGPCPDCVHPAFAAATVRPETPVAPALHAFAAGAAGLFVRSFTASNVNALSMSLTFDIAAPQVEHRLWSCTASCRWAA
mgnify:CR=1 FL=1